MNIDVASNTEEFNADIVVAGGGGAGLAAAVAATEKGAKVIVLEKRRAFGGNTAMGGSLFAAESPFQKRMMVDAPKDQLFKLAMDYAHWRINPRIVRAFVDKSGDTIRWLEEKGVKFSDFGPVYPSQSPLVAHCPEGGGAAITKALIKRCEELGVQLISQAAVKRILTDSIGNVTGALATMKRKELKITAKSVIIATGGYGGNKKLLKKYYPSYNENLICNGLPHNGDGLLMATAIGAATEGLGTLLLSGTACPGSMMMQAITGEPTPVLVNKRGERFMDEGISVHFERGNPVDLQPDKTCYALFDNVIKKHLIEGGFVHYFGVRFGLQRGTKPDEWEKEFQLQANKGNVKISTSWEDVAQWIGTAPNVLKATIDEYNSFCDRGHDELFAKDPRYLLPLRIPPYYAIKCYTGFLNSIGGIKINHHMEVLNREDKPMPGLYAAGVDTGGWEGETYGGRHLSGSAIGFAINSGRIAGENATRYIS